MDYTNYTPDESCRTCKHGKRFHYPLLGKENKPPYPCSFNNFNNYTNINRKACSCKEFLPEDNLEYLEYISGKQR